MLWRKMVMGVVKVKPEWNSDDMIKLELKCMIQTTRNDRLGVLSTCGKGSNEWGPSSIEMYSIFMDMYVEEIVDFKTEEQRKELSKIKWDVLISPDDARIQASSEPFLQEFLYVSSSRNYETWDGMKYAKMFSATIPERDHHSTVLAIWKVDWTQLGTKYQGMTITSDEFYWSLRWECLTTRWKKGVW